MGNIRLSYSDSNGDGAVEASEIREEKHYYPFGLQHKGYNNVTNGTHYPYGFNGKEEQQELDLNWLDFGARNYDATLGRWMNIDPLADAQYAYSPYHYAYNSPIMYNDPTGMIGESITTNVINEDTGETYWIDDGFNFDFYVSADDFATIQEEGAIPKELRSKHLRAFLKEVGREMKKQQEDNWLSKLLHFFFYDDIGDGMVAVSQSQYGKAALSIAAGKLKKLRGLKKWVKTNKGKKIPGTKKGGVTFSNDSRGGGQVLPKKDANGNPITYKEYDINSAPKPGQTRGAERMVVGSDGKAYYTDNHYKTFTEIKD